MKRSTDAGVTLIELLLAVALTVILMAVLATSMIVGLQGARATAETLADSADAQGLSAYLAQDIHSVSSSSGVTVGAHSTGCASSADTPLLRLQWAGDDGGGSFAFSASYRYVESTDASSTGNQKRWLLKRYFCPLTTPASAASITIVARNLADPTAAATAPVIDASDAARLAVTLTDIQTDGSTYKFTISGAYRTRAGGSVALPPPPPPPPPTPAVIGTPVVLDTNTDGKLDTIQVDFSDPVDAACANGWTVAGLPTGFTPPTTATLAASRTRATLSIASGASDFSTAAVGTTVRLTKAGACDPLNGNLPLPALDQAAPVAYKVTSITQGLTAGKMELGDELEILFSEPVIGVPAGAATVTLTAGTSGAADTLQITAGALSLTRGAISTGGSGGNRYVDPNKSATAVATLTSSSSTRAVVKIGVVTGAADLRAGQGAMSLILAPTVLDLAVPANAAPATAPATASSFRLF